MHKYDKKFPKKNLMIAIICFLMILTFFIVLFKENGEEKYIVAIIAVMVLLMPIFLVGLVRNIRYCLGYLDLNVDFSYEYNKFNRLSKVYVNKELHKEFSYDTLGRLTYFKGLGIYSKSYQYDGDNLYPNKINGLTCKFSGNGLLYSYGDNTYEYDYNGLRYSQKASKGTTIKYYYVGDRLLGEDYSNGIQIRYMYDQEGIVGARYINGSQVTEYEYVKDGFNNVIAIVKDNTVVVRYVYDAWGNVIKQIPNTTNMDPFAKINPIRYRSYYFDIETGLYYLQTRYYDPEIGAFISPDNVDYLDQKNIGGLNLYTYCYNNPVMYIDPSGHLAFWLLTALVLGGIGLIAGGTYAGIKSYEAGNRGWNLAGHIALGALLGGAAGFAIGALLGSLASILLTGSATSSVGMVITGFKGFAWACSLGGPKAAFRYIANNVYKLFHKGANLASLYPPNDGFDGPTQSITLEKGTVIQRFGDEKGTYIAPFFTDPFSLSLPYYQLPNIYEPNLYVVTEPIVVTAGPAAPWYGQYGGGMQYVLPNTIENLSSLHPFS